MLIEIVEDFMEGCSIIAVMLMGCKNKGNLINQLILNVVEQGIFIRIVMIKGPTSNPGLI